MHVVRFEKNISAYNLYHCQCLLRFRWILHYFRYSPGSSVVYSPVYILHGRKDTRSMAYDIKRYVDLKHANVTIKFNYILRKNLLAQLSIKLNVLGTCVNLPLTYDCKTWGIAAVNLLDVTNHVYTNDLLYQSYVLSQLFSYTCI